MKTRQFSFYFHYEPWDDDNFEHREWGNYLPIEEDGELQSICSHLTFNVEGPDKLWASFNANHSLLEDKSMEMEKHGIHDISQEDHQVAGFDSYEIHPDHQFEVMEEWKKWFEDQGFTCSPIVVRELKADGEMMPLTPEERDLYK